MIPTSLTEHTVRPSTGPGLSLQNPYCVRFTIDGTALARQGAMVAYRGELAITTKGQGVRNLMKRAVTGEGLPLMQVSGRGEMWFADLAKNVTVLDGDGLCVAGRSVLCFEDGLSYEVKMIKSSGMAGGGLFNCTFSGSGSIAVSSDGEPMVLPVTPELPVYVDTDAVIGWTSALTATAHRSESAKSFLKGGSGEMYQLKLSGTGSVIVQPSEGPILPKKDGVGEMIGDLLS